MSEASKRVHRPLASDQHHFLQGGNSVAIHKSTSTKNQNCVTHGEARKGQKTREYLIWKAMLNRCRNPRNYNFNRYGGRGISVCERWLDYAVFKADMGPRPPGYTLERINNDADYEVGNVRWATRAEQARNTSRTRLFTHQGVTLCITDWAIRLGFRSYADIWQRLQAGWSLERALTTPKKRQLHRGHAATASAKLKP